MRLDADFEYINEAFEADSVTPAQLDILLANGWRHFGNYFFRYNLGIHGWDIERVTPLRIRLANFSFSKSQRRVLRKNGGLDFILGSSAIDNDCIELFERHKQRFAENVPGSISEFLSTDGSDSPTDTREIRVYENEDLVAASWFDLGERTASGIYGIFEPSIAKRSLGILTLLKEIEYAVELEKEFYYLGYAYEGRSFYDYKKRFRGTETFDWNGNWENLATERTEITEI